MKHTFTPLTVIYSAICESVKTIVTLLFIFEVWPYVDANTITPIVNALAMHFIFVKLAVILCIFVAHN